MGNTLPAHLAGLLDPAAYPHPVQGVTVIGTHMSWVLLTGAFAYKIKRPVRFDFVDLCDPAHRAFLCREELRLNRRFAPELYLEVCPITSEDGHARIGGPGPAIEYAVKMRQFAPDEQLDRLLGAGAIDPQAMARFGKSLAAAHEELPAAAPDGSLGTPASVRGIMADNAAQCAQSARVFDATAEVMALRQTLQRRLEGATACMSERFARRRVRECHGDLHSRNIARVAGQLLAFDCLEFDPALRWIDVADEIAFLLADLDASGRPVHAQAFLGGYLEQGGDFQACRLLNLYKAHRSLVRAKVLALMAEEIPGNRSDARARPHVGQPALAEFSRWLEFARRALQPGGPMLILMSGLSGSGKTWLAERLAPGLGAVHVRSDIERKRLTGLAPHARSNSSLARGLYSAEMTEAVYGRLEQCARDVLSGGLTSIIDATFQRRTDRTRFSSLARELRVGIQVICCRAPQSTLERRVSDRLRGGADASEADLSVVRWQSANFEPVRADEALTVLDVSTEEPGIADRLVRELRELIVGK